MDIEEVFVQLMETSNLSSSSTSTNSNNIDESDSSSENTISISSGEEEIDVLLFPLMYYLITGRRKHRIENYIQVVDSWTSQEFKEHLRLTQNTAFRLIGIEYFVKIYLIII